MEFGRHSVLISWHGSRRRNARGRTAQISCLLPSAQASSRHLAISPFRLPVSLCGQEDGMNRAGEMVKPGRMNRPQAIADQAGRT
jgi:hypothetical protein